MRIRIHFDKKRLVSFILAGLTFWVISSAQASPGNSVVRIKVDNDRGTSVGTGFIWPDPGYVVTALHVVAGATKISVYSESGKKSSSAKIHTALLEPDLALLKLDRDLGLSPLREAIADPNSTETHFIWGYPHDVAEMTRHKVEMVGGLSQFPSLASLFKNKRQLENTIGSQGYPALEAKIFRITKIQPGHSGAPILDNSGKVIGIGDGGLRDGLGGLNWAIPSAHYLPKLVNSRDPIPESNSAQSNLFNVSINEKPITFTETARHVLRRVWSAPILEILNSMEDENLFDDYRDLDASAREDANRSLESATVDVYEDEETGATFAVPKGMKFRYDTDDKLMVVSNESGPRMFIQAVISNDWEASLDNIRSFTGLLDRLGADWQRDPDWRDRKVIDEDNRYAFYDLYRQVADDFDEDLPPLAELDTVLIVDNRNFLGTAVVALNTDSFSDSDWYNHYLMMMCVKLADFSGY